MFYENTVRLQGKIVYKRVYNGMAHVGIETTKSADKSAANVLSVAVFGELVDNLSSFSVGDYVYITGKMSEISGKEKKQLKQDVVAKTIEKAKSRLNEFGISDPAGAIERKNEVYLAGKVKGKYTRPGFNVATIFVDVLTDGHTENLSIRVFVRPDTIDKISNLQKGDNLAIAGMIQTKDRKGHSKRPNGNYETIHYENLVAMELTTVTDKAKKPALA